MAFGKKEPKVEKAPDVVLIDGTNFFFKGSWGGEELTHDGHSVKELYSFQLNLCSLVRQFGKTLYIVCWDGGHRERTELSQEAVRAGLIPKAYKQERREARELNPDGKGEDFIWQLEKGREMLFYTRIAQMRYDGEEADDLVSSYCRQFLDLGKTDIVVVTSDKDYYQLLWDGVRIYNSTKKEFLDKSYLKSEYNLDNADQWVDVGALAGETGPSSDTIYGCPGIGYKTAAKLISQYGSLQAIYDKANSLFGDFVKVNGLDEFAKRVMTGCYKTKQLKEAKILANKPVIDLAWKLKKMHTGLNLPIPEAKPDWKGLDEFFSDLDFNVSFDNKDTLLGV